MKNSDSIFFYADEKSRIRVNLALTRVVEFPRKPVSCVQLFPPQPVRHAFDCFQFQPFSPGTHQCIRARAGSL